MINNKPLNIPKLIFFLPQTSLADPIIPFKPTLEKQHNPRKKIEIGIYITDLYDIDFAKINIQQSYGSGFFIKIVTTTLLRELS